MDSGHTVLVFGTKSVGWDELRQILNTLPGIRVIGDVKNVALARRIATATPPDAIITAPVIGGRQAIPLITNIRQLCCPTAKVILMASEYTSHQLRSPEVTGIVGYLLWADLSPTVLRHCLAAIIAGDVVLGSRVVVTDFINNLRGDGGVQHGHFDITARARSVLNRLARGQTREEIAAAESISLATVKRIIAELEVKLEAPNLFVLAVKATQLGLVYS